MRKIIIGFVCGLVFAANVWAEAVVRTYGPTISSDTIWSIATKLRPSDEVSVSQVIVGIFNTNKDAFYSDNINALDDGKIIKIPDISVIREISENKANKEIIIQNRKWQQSSKNSKRHSVRVKERNLTQSVAVVSTDAVSSTQLPANDLVKEQQESIIKELTSRLVEAETKYNVAQTQITILSDRISLLEKDINELNILNQKKKNSYIGGIFSSVQQRADLLSSYLGQKLFMGIIAGIVLLLLSLLIFLIIPQRKKDVTAGYPQDDSLGKKDDFDPMSGNEGTVAKLNLARAYIEMGQESKAQAMLYEVLSYGNDDEQAEAKGLLDKIKEKSEIVY